MSVYMFMYIHICMYIIYIHIWYFFWPPRAACGILVPQLGVGPGPSAVKAPSPNHWTAREFPYIYDIFLIDLYWSIITSQYCVSFCCTTKQISHMHTHVPISPPSWASLPSSLSHPSRPLQSTKPISLCYAAASHSVVYICWCYSHFAPASPSHPMSSSPFSMSVSLFLSCP